MVDSEGHIRKEVLRLICYIGDLPEQALIPCLAPNQCVCCLARTADFGNAEECLPRTSQSILDQIRNVRQSLVPTATIMEDTWEFSKAARKAGLNGVEEPWWMGFQDLDICQVIAPDVLHGSQGFQRPPYRLDYELGRA